MDLTKSEKRGAIKQRNIVKWKDTVINKTADDGNRNVTTYTYDDQNRVTGVSRKNGNETISNSISYDMRTDGKTTTSVKDANGHVNKEVTNEADLMKSENKKKDSEGRSCKKIAKDNKAVWNLELIQ